MKCQCDQFWVAVYRVFDKRLGVRRERCASDERNGLTQRCRRVDPPRELTSNSVFRVGFAQRVATVTVTNLIAVCIRKRLFVSTPGAAVPSARYRYGMPLAVRPLRFGPQSSAGCRTCVRVKKALAVTYRRGAPPRQSEQR